MARATMTQQRPLWLTRALVVFFTVWAGAELWFFWPLIHDWWLQTLRQ